MNIDRVMYREKQKRPVRPYRQASPSPARHRPGAGSAPGFGDLAMIPQTTLICEEFIVRTRTRTCRPHLEILEDRCMPSTFAAFGLDTPERGPFPSDRFTVADDQLTGRRVNLPLPDASPGPRTMPTSASSTRWMASTCSRGCPSRSAARST